MRRLTVVKHALSLFGVRVARDNVLKVTAAGACTIRVARRVGDHAPVWKLPFGHDIPLPAGDHLVAVDGAPGDGPVELRFAAPAIVVSIPAPRDGTIETTVAFECSAALTGNPKDPWPPPPPPPPPFRSHAEMTERLIPAAERRWFDRQLLPLAASLPRGAAEPAIHALLIGIDHYPPPDDPKRLSIRSLGGCVADILGVKAYLRDELGLAPARITTLLAPLPGSSHDVDGAELPTYQAIVAAWKRLIAEVQAGEQIYVHYAGHGARVPTAYAAVKGAGARDECLVPCDANRPGGRYLRDAELAHLLAEMQARGQVVTLVMDSCHAAGLSRGAAVARGVEILDGGDAGPSEVASPDELAHAAAQLQARAADGSAWNLGDPPGYTLLAACQANELAYECRFDGGPMRGALTTCWLDVLRARWPGLGYRAAHQRIVAEVHRRIGDQTPALLGDGEREVLGHGRARRPGGLAVLDVQGERVQLAGGAASAVGAGSLFTIVPLRDAPETVDLDALPRVEVEQVGDTDCWARRVDGTSAAIGRGDQAIPRRYSASVTQRVHVPGAGAMLDELRAQIDADASRLLVRAADADLTVAVEPAGPGAARVTFTDSGGHTLAYAELEVALDVAGAATRVHEHLRHLARFRNVRSLSNGDRLSTLTDQVRAELRASPDGPPLPQPARLVHGQRAFLRITNLARCDVHLAVLDLQPDWGISTFAPTDGHLQLPSGASETLELTARLPDGWPPGSRGTDVLKVIATTRPVDVTWLELPALGAALQPRHAGDAVEDLERLFAMLTHAPVEARHAVPASSKIRWLTLDVELETTIRHPPRA